MRRLTGYFYRYTGTEKETLDTTWMSFASCLSYDAEIWFPERGHRSLRRAVKICNECAVQPECLRHALELRVRVGPITGVWGGMQMEPLTYTQAEEALRR